MQPQSKIDILIVLLSPRQPGNEMIGLFALFLISLIHIASSFSSSSGRSTRLTISPTLLSRSFIEQNVFPSTSRLLAISQIEDDGYSISNKERFKGLKTIFSKVRDRLTGNINKPGTLILVRHGESEWNFNGTFTGWVDVDLSARGQRELEHAARLLLERGYTIDVTYTSRLKRAIRSTWIILRELNQIYRPVYKSYHLNERMYGALEGKSKKQLAEELGKEQVLAWRSGYEAKPPPMDETHPFWHKNERKYSDLRAEEIPETESLEDTMLRTIPLWYKRIEPNLKSGRNVMVVAHGNSLRGIVKHINNLTASEIQNVGIPNGIPLVFKFDEKMKAIPLANCVAPLYM